jgi:3-hydroxy-9,10-secoandrosta-1,3,5(10)-triene-9,17-dione monooxygenase reductase component
MAADEKLNAIYDSMRSGLYIVTSAWRKRVSGCTCLWVSRVSFDPSLIAIHLSPSRYTCETIERGKRFALHTVADDSVDLARRFGLTSSRDVDKFEGTAWEPGRGAVPILSYCATVLQCKLAGVEPQGDHHLLLGEVVDGTILREVPQLIYDPRTFYELGEVRAEEMVGGSGAA